MGTGEGVVVPRGDSGAKQNEASDFPIVDLGLYVVNIVCRIELVDVFRNRGVFNTHSFVSVADPVVFRSPDSSVADLRRKVAAIAAKGALPQRVRQRCPDRVGQQSGLHVFNVLRETLYILTLGSVGILVPVRSLEDFLVRVSSIYVGGLNFEDPSQALQLQGIYSLLLSSGEFK